MKNYIFSVIFLLITCGSVAAEKIDKISSEADFEYFSHSYYLHPQPDLIPQAINFLSRNKIIEKHKNSAAPTFVFFAKIFKDNPKSIKDWKEVIEKQDQYVQNLLNRAIDTDYDQLFANMQIGPQLNDMYWAAFFASGDLDYVNKIISHLKHIEERQNMLLYVTAATAKWSLSSNAKRHPQIKHAIKNMKNTDIPNYDIIAKDILSSDPEKFNEEMIEVLRVQHEKGVW